MRKRLLQEARAPWRGLRRGIWFACFGSASLGIGVMGFRSAAGYVVPFNDLLIQFLAFGIFGALLFFDRRRSD